MADELRKIQNSIQALETKVNDLHNKSEKRWQEIIQGRMWRNDQKLHSMIEKNAAEINKDAEQTAKNVQTLVKKFAEIDKMIAELKKVMDAMEVRHVKLVDTTIKNYDKLIRKFISQEVAKASKGRR